MQSQPAITDWPALLTLEGACRYLSLERAEYLALAERWRVYPVEVDSNAPVWRLTDLRLLVKRLPAAKRLLDQLGQPRQLHLDHATIELLAEAVAARLNLKGSVSDPVIPQLVAIKDAARQLGLGRSTVYQMIKRGLLRVQHIGRRTLVTQESIQGLIGK